MSADPETPAPPFDGVSDRVIDRVIDRIIEPGPESRIEIGLDDLERDGMAWPPARWERPVGVWRPDAWLAPPPDVFVPVDVPPASVRDAREPESTEAAAEERVGGSRVIREAIETLLMAGVMLVVLMTLVRNYKIEGTSMAPTLAPAEYILVSKLAYRAFGDPARGDIIVFLDWNNRQDYIKRVVGLPGETVEVRDGGVWIDGGRLDEPYLKGAPTGGGGGPRQLGADEYYVLGDNRGNSSDSRIHGALPRDHIMGRAWFTYWPLDRFGRIGHSNDDAADSSG